MRVTCPATTVSQFTPAADMAQKVRAAVDARSDLDLVLTARTEARAVAGIEEAVRRGREYAHAAAARG